MRCAIVDANGAVLACIMADDVTDPIPGGYPKGCSLIASEDSGEGDSYVNGKFYPKPYTSAETSNMAAKGIQPSPNDPKVLAAKA